MADPPSDSDKDIFLIVDDDIVDSPTKAKYFLSFLKTEKEEEDDKMSLEDDVGVSFNDNDERSSNDDEMSSNDNEMPSNDNEMPSNDNAESSNDNEISSNDDDDDYTTASKKNIIHDSRMSAENLTAFLNDLQESTKLPREWRAGSSKDFIISLDENVSKTKGDKKNVMKSTVHKMPSTLGRDQKVIGSHATTGSAGDGKNVNKFANYAIAGPSKGGQNMRRLHQDVAGSLNDGKNVIKSQNDAIPGSSKGRQNIKEASYFKKSSNARRKIVRKTETATNPETVTKSETIIIHPGYPNERTLSEDEMSIISNVSGIVIDLSDDSLSETDGKIETVEKSAETTRKTDTDTKSGTLIIKKVRFEVPSHGTSADDEDSSSSSEFEIPEEEEVPGTLTTREIMECCKQVEKAMKRVNKMKCGNEILSNSNLTVREKITTRSNSDNSKNQISSVRKGIWKRSDSKSDYQKYSLGEEEATRTKFSYINVTPKHEATSIPDEGELFSSEYEEPYGRLPVKRKISNCENLESENAPNKRKSICGPLSYKISVLSHMLQENHADVTSLKELLSRSSVEKDVNSENRYSRDEQEVINISDDEDSSSSSKDFNLPTKSTDKYDSENGKSSKNLISYSTGPSSGTNLTHTIILPKKKEIVTESDNEKESSLLENQLLNCKIWAKQENIIISDDENELPNYIPPMKTGIEVPDSVSTQSKHVLPITPSVPLDVKQNVHSFSEDVEPHQILSPPPRNANPENNESIKPVSKRFDCENTSSKGSQNCNPPIRQKRTARFGGENQLFTSRNVYPPIQQEVVNVNDDDDNQSSRSYGVTECNQSVKKDPTSRFGEGNQLYTSGKPTTNFNRPIKQKTTRVDEGNQPFTNRNLTEHNLLFKQEKVTVLDENGPSETRKLSSRCNVQIKQEIMDGKNELYASRNFTDCNLPIKQEVMTVLNNAEVSASSSVTANRNLSVKQETIARFDSENQSSRCCNCNLPMEQQITENFDDNNKPSTSKTVTKDVDTPSEQQLTEVFDGCNEPSTSRTVTTNHNSQIKHKSSTEVFDDFNKPSTSRTVTTDHNSLIKQKSSTEVFDNFNEPSTSKTITDLEIKDEYEITISDNDFELSDNEENVQCVFPSSSQQTTSRANNDCVLSKNEEFLQSVMANKSLEKLGIKERIEDGWVHVDTSNSKIRFVRPKKCSCFKRDTFMNPFKELEPCEGCVLGEQARKEHQEYVRDFTKKNRPFVHMTMEEVAATKYIDHWVNCNIKVVGRLGVKVLTVLQSKKGSPAPWICQEESHEFYLQSIDEPNGPYHVCIDFQMMKRPMPVAGQRIQAFAELRITPRGEPLLMAYLYINLPPADRRTMKAYMDALEQMRKYVPLSVRPGAINPVVSQAFADEEFDLSNV